MYINQEIIQEVNNEITQKVLQEILRENDNNISNNKLLEPPFLLFNNSKNNEIIQETKKDIDKKILHNALPVPPLFVFSKKIQKMLLSIARGKNIPVEMAICAFLALGSCCLGRTRGVILNDEWREYANLFFLLIAETGIGKSHVFNYFFEFVREIDEQLILQWKEDWENYQTDFDDWKKSKKEERGDKPMPPKKKFNLVNDATIEAVVERLEHNPRGLFWEVDEFAGFFGKLDRYNKNGAGDSKNKLLSMWDSAKVSVSRKNNEGVSNEIHVNKATIGMFGAIQPHLLSQTFTYSDVMQGVPQRFIFIRAQQLQVPQLPTPKIESWISNDIQKITRRLLELEMVNNERGLPEAEFLTLTDDARNAFYDFYNMMMKKTAHSEMAGYAAKMARITLRLALIIHFLEWAISDNVTYSRHIGFNSMDAATDLANYFMAHTEKVHMLLPTLKNKDGERDITSAERIMAQIIIDKKEEIEKYEYKVPSSIFYKFFEKIFNIRRIDKILANFDIKSGRSNSKRYKILSEEIIKKCEQMLVVSDLFE